MFAEEMFRSPLHAISQHLHHGSGRTDKAPRSENRMLHYISHISTSISPNSIERRHSHRHQLVSLPRHS